MNRRLFVSALAGLSALGPSMVLEAIVGPELPKTLLVPGLTAVRHGLFELRRYRTLGGDEKIFHRNGIHPMLRGHRTYLIPFQSLEARGRAWDAVAADPEWNNARASVSRIEIYRAAGQPGGSILEMSL